MSLSKHLGGHLNKTHVDEGSLNWSINLFNIKSFLDVGCGPGGMVELANSKNLYSLGIDGDYTLKRFDSSKFIIHDFTKGSLVLDQEFDLCWSCEFVEHVEEIYVDNYMKTIASARRVIMTYAPPGKPGHHHVNCKPAEYWIDVFKKYNFIHDEDLTDQLRKHSSMKKPFVQNYGLFFNKSI